jgi:hypothetical protein
MIYLLFGSAMQKLSILRVFRGTELALSELK